MLDRSTPTLHRSLQLPPCAGAIALLLRLGRGIGRGRGPQGHGHPPKPEAQLPRWEPRAPPAHVHAGGSRATPAPAADGRRVQPANDSSSQATTPLADRHRRDSAHDQSCGEIAISGDFEPAEARPLGLNVLCAAVHSVLSPVHMPRRRFSPPLLHGLHQHIVLSALRSVLWPDSHPMAPINSMAGTQPPAVRADALSAAAGARLRPGAAAAAAAAPGVASGYAAGGRYQPAAALARTPWPRKR